MKFGVHFIPVKLMGPDTLGIIILSDRYPMLSKHCINGTFLESKTFCYNWDLGSVIKHLDSFQALFRSHVFPAL